MKKFDISDGKNKYEPCLKCGASDGMGVTSHGGMHVVCGYCNHEGKSFAVDRNNPSVTDKLAFDAWNAESLTARAAVAA